MACRKRAIRLIIPKLSKYARLGLRKDECCVVGDSLFDIKAAEEAGISHVFILNEDKERFTLTDAEVCGSVKELQRKIEQLMEKEG